MEMMKDEFVNGDQQNGGQQAEIYYYQNIKFLTARKNDIYRTIIEPQLQDINYQQIAMKTIPGLSQAQATDLLEMLNYNY